MMQAEVVGQGFPCRLCEEFTRDQSLWEYI